MTAYPDFVFRSRRSCVYATGGMVAASQPAAVSAGLQMLAEGGSAADAAIAVAAALSVLEPCSTGIGGDAFALVYSADDGTVHALNGSGRSPANLTPLVFAESGMDEIPERHGLAVTVPAACAAWCALHERFGKLDREKVFAPAVRLARDGFAVGPVTSELWSNDVELLRKHPNGNDLLVQGRAPQTGERVRNPYLADVLEAVGKRGRDAFYSGRVAAAVTAAVRAAGGVLTEDDLADCEAEWVRPLSLEYAGKHGTVRVHECPPNGQGIVALSALGMLRHTDHAEFASLSAERLHRQIEALRLGFADARRYVCDPAFAAYIDDVSLRLLAKEVEEETGPDGLSHGGAQDVSEAARLAHLLYNGYGAKGGTPAGPLTTGSSDVAWNALLDPEYTALRARRIQSDKRNAAIMHGTPDAFSDTVQFCVTDAEGNAVSMVNSVYMNFGSGIVPDACGFALQNRGHNFSLVEGHPNCVAPRKRPYHTIIPCLTTLPDGRLHGVMGVMGGFMQPQGHVQVLSAMLDDGLDPQSALDLPRFCIQPDGSVSLEEGMHEDVVEALKEYRHPVSVVQGYARKLFGRGQIILCDHEQGIVTGASDARSDGCAFGL